MLIISGFIFKQDIKKELSRNIVGPFKIIDVIAINHYISTNNESVIEQTLLFIVNVVIDPPNTISHHV